MISSLPETHGGEHSDRTLWRNRNRNRLQVVRIRGYGHMAHGGLCRCLVHCHGLLCCLLLTTVSLIGNVGSQTGRTFLKKTYALSPIPGNISRNMFHLCMFNPAWYTNINLPDGSRQSVTKSPLQDLIAAISEPLAKSNENLLPLHSQQTNTIKNPIQNKEKSWKS